MSSPLLTYAGLLERSTSLIHAYVHNDPMVVGYVFWGQRSVADAYGDPLYSGVGGVGPLSLFQVLRGQSYRSPALRRKGLGLIEENRRGTTHLLFDIEDFVVPAGGGPAVGPDTNWLFLRAQEARDAGPAFYPDVPTADMRMVGVIATDQVIVKGIYFEFQAGANNLAGRTGLIGQPFLIGLGAGDNDAAANLAAAFNDAADVAAQMDLQLPVNTHTFALNPGAPSPDVSIAPEDAAANLLPGSIAQFTVTTPSAPRVLIDPDVVTAGTLIYQPDLASPVLGPIYCIPPATYFGTREPTFTLSGVAPSGSASAAGGLPDLDEDYPSAAPRALHLVFPKPLTALSIRNLSAVNLLVSFGPEQAMRNVPANGELALYTGTTKELLLACPDGVAGAGFTLHGVTSGETP